ncbi:MAG: heme NO-binding domain-containing protein [Candidatus Kariarchaeaceae archaeon]|jgi:hypothetical protein
MITQKLDLRTLNGRIMLYQFSRYIIKRFGQVFWHQIVHEFTTRWSDFDLTLNYDNPLYQELLNISCNYTGASVQDILSGFAVYQMN